MGYRQQSGGTDGGTKSEFKYLNPVSMRVSSHHSIDPSPYMKIPTLIGWNLFYLFAQRNGIFSRERSRPTIQHSCGFSPDGLEKQIGLAQAAERRVESGVHWSAQGLAMAGVGPIVLPKRRYNPRCCGTPVDIEVVRKTRQNFSIHCLDGDSAAVRSQTGLDKVPIDAQNQS